MSEQQPDNQAQDDFGQLTGHNYDGIQEYDNPTPAWWTWVFIASIFFAACYMFLTLIAAGDLSPSAEYERAAVANLKKKFGEIGTLDADAKTIVEYMNKPEWLQLGENVFKAKCTTCHGANGQGGPAPNLTDDNYIHIKAIEDFARVVTEGVVAKGMPSWGQQLHPNEIVLVSSYLVSIRNTNVSGGKAAEGDVPPEQWPKPGEMLDAPVEAESAEAEAAQ